MGRSTLAAGDGLAVCFLAGAGSVVPRVSLLPESARSRGLALSHELGSGCWASVGGVETRKEGRESLLVIWVLPSPPAAGALRWSLEAGSSTVPAWPLMGTAASPAAAAVVASRPRDLASGKLQEELSGFSGRATTRKVLCPDTEGDRFMPAGLETSAGGFGAPLPFVLASAQPFPDPRAGLSVVAPLARPSVCAGDGLASGLVPSAGMW